MFTTTSITAVSVSTRSAHATCRSPELIQGNSAILYDIMVQEADVDQHHPGQAAETNRSPVVISSAARDPCAGGSETWWSSWP